MSGKGMTEIRSNGEDFFVNDPNIADEFSESVSYSVGDFFTHEGKLYIVTAAHPAGAWNSGHVSQVKLGAHIAAENSAISSRVDGVSEMIAKESPAIPNVRASSEKQEWDGTSPEVDEFFVPMTVKKQILFSGFDFVTTFSSACTLTVKIKDKNNTETYASASAAIAASGKQNVKIYIPVILEAAEYRVEFSVSAGSVYYANRRGEDFISDDFITSEGTVYFYNNNGVAFVGNLMYVLDWDSAFINTIERSDYQIPLENVVASNPDILIDGSWQTNGPTIDPDTKVITIDRSTSGNEWFSYQINNALLENNFAKVDFDLELESGTVAVWLFGKKTDNTDLYGLQGYVSESGHVTRTIDLNYYVVYENLDLAKDIRIGVGSGSIPSKATISNFSLTTPRYSFDVTSPFYTQINSIYNRTNENANAINNLESKEYLTAPNGRKYILAVDNSGELHTIPAIPDHTLFVGNSLLFGNGNFGMCASAGTKDYYYYVSQQIIAKNSGATFEKLLGTGFEGATSVSAAENWMQTTLLPKLGDGVNLVIVQLGDNVNTADKTAAFEQTCAELIRYIRENAPNARIAWAGEWYSTAQKQEIISSACAANNATFIDFTPLLGTANNSYIGAVVNYGVSAERTYSIDSYTDDTANHILTIEFTVNGTQYTTEVPYTSYTTSSGTISITGSYGFVDNAGVASHPGDSGMSAIGTLMIEKLGLD